MDRRCRPPDMSNFLCLPAEPGELLLGFRETEGPNQILRETAVAAPWCW